MELRHLRYCLAVAEDLSFTKAAARLRIAQPALSRQIIALEQEIDAKLFRRLSRGVALTEPGRAFVTSARAILADVEAAVAAARRAHRGELGLLRIGFTGSASFNPFVTGSIRDFRTAFPDVEIELVEEHTTHLLEHFRAGRLDVAFIRGAPGEAEFLWTQTLPAEPLVAALPFDHPLASRRRVSLAGLSRDAFILYPRRNGRALFDAIVGACEGAGFSPNVLQIAPQLTSVVNLVSTGIGVSIVPASMSQVATGGVVYRPFSRGGPKAPMTLVRTQAPEPRSAIVFTDLVMAKLRRT